MAFGLPPAPTFYEIRPRKDKDGIDLISGRFRYCPVGTQDQMPSATRSQTRSTAPSRTHTGRLSM
jgi:hypothetical protein